MLFFFFFLGGLIFWHAYCDCSGGLLNEVSSRCWFIERSWRVYYTSVFLHQRQKKTEQ